MYSKNSGGKELRIKKGFCKYNIRMKRMWKEGWFIAYFMFDELTITTEKKWHQVSRAPSEKENSHAQFFIISM